MWEMICRGFGWKRKRDDDSFQRAKVAGSCLLTAWGRCDVQGGGGVDFSRLFLPARFLNGCMLHSWFPMQNTVAEHFWQALVVLQ